MSGKTTLKLLTGSYFWKYYMWLLFLSTASLIFLMSVIKLKYYYLGINKQIVS